jgi:ABC-type bacteriocin/lantibiotic exporter with double-glycine peptidase domain
MSKIMNRQVGAGGFWTVINERKDDSVVRQSTPFSCVAAVGEMLLRERKIEMTQTEIIDIIGEASTTKQLAYLLNEKDKSSPEKWHGIIVSVKYLEMIAKRSAFGAVLREGNPLGHLVLVETLSGNLLSIKDPWDGTKYEMTTEEFLKVWNGEIVFKWNLSA